MKASTIIVIAFATIVLIGAVTASIYGIPAPATHDEFSYLLGASTLLRGRFSNPFPANFEAFETFHVLMFPTYASKYPPGQSIFLALGAWIWDPVLGVWISSAIAVAACLWALKPDFEVDGLAIVACVATTLIGFSYWNNSYWGGSVAASGGALFFGALRRTLSGTHWRNGAMAGLGAGILLLSRPFEGSVFCLITLCCHIICNVPVLRKVPAIPGRLRKIPGTATAFALVASLAAIVSLRHNHAVTGELFTLPHTAYGRTYLSTPPFLFQDLRVAVRESFDLLVKFNQHEREIFSSARSNFWAGFTARMNGGLVDFYFYPVFLWLALLAPARRNTREIMTSFVIPLVLGVSFALLVTTTAFAHYMAPFSVLIIGVIATGILNLARMTPHRSVKGLIVSTVLLIAVLARAQGYFKECEKSRFSWQNYRKEMKKTMEATGDRHLVFVEYSPGHSFHAEWVFNDANIMDSRVIWARHRSIELDREVVQEIRKQSKHEIITWKLDPDQKMGLTTYPL